MPAPPDASSPRPFRRVGAAAGRLVSLRAEAVVVAAVKQAGTTELGIETISEPLEVLCAALEEEADLHLGGRRAARRRLVDALVRRAEALGAVAADPTVDERPLSPPVVLAAPPGRTGRRLREALGAGPGRPAGDGSLLEVALASMEPELDWFVPGWSEWLDGADLTQGYRWLRRLLVLESSPDRPEVWRLDAPQHLERLGELSATVAPRALVVVEGDRSELADEGAEEIATRRARWSSRHDPDGVRRYWRWRLERMLDRHREQRTALGAVEVVAVDAAAVRADPAAVAARLEDRLGSGR